LHNQSIDRATRRCPIPHTPQPPNPDGSDSRSDTRRSSCARSAVYRGCRDARRLIQVSLTAMCVMSDQRLLAGFWGLLGWFVRRRSDILSRPTGLEPQFAGKERVPPEHEPIAVF